ncbi:hypothetical protein HW115_19040 [Verrucomicrobiaceae bacterium N1E253]|uniref:Uncharacterized protein n=1 Tax=Oceaniferula marina TaxID=2748318 RepID=A0A851GKZ1_9BACT|nr:hypothetical protein [Oceaniferula marina]NWK57722.1 hypothetical protein [Oceaniferula marina]
MKYHFIVNSLFALIFASVGCKEKTESSLTGQVAPVLHIAAFKVVDANNGEPVKVGVKVHTDLINGTTPIQLVEFMPNGSCRLTWLSHDGEGGVTLSADGYVPIDVPSNAILTTSNLAVKTRPLSNHLIKIHPK